MDSTHSVTHYEGYLLTTLVVLDDFMEGVPVAWFISNREDSEALCVFLEEVKSRCGEIHTSLFHE